MLTKKQPKTSEEFNSNKRASTPDLFPSQKATTPPADKETASEPRKTRASNGNAKTHKSASSKILVHYDVGFHNHLTIRGKGAGLSWHIGTPLKNIGADQWILEINQPFDTIEFKILINDHHYETGENRILRKGESIEYSPQF